MTHQPMRGVRILEVAQFTFTPAAGAVLADWGADVIKVEHAERGDGQRGLSIGAGSAKDGNFQPLMEHPNRGKRSIGLALEKPEALEILYELARTSDVFLVNFLPASRQRLKIDIEHIRAVNPSIIYVRGSAFGNKGPERERGGYDSSAFWARGGAAYGSTPSDIDRIAWMPAIAFGDTIGGMTIAGGISAALYSRAVTGEPSEVDVSLLSVGAWASAVSVANAMVKGSSDPVMPTSMHTAPVNPLVGNYRTSDGRWIHLTMLQAAKYWPDFCTRIGRPELIDDERFTDPLRLMSPDGVADAQPLIAEAFLEHPYTHWVDAFDGMDGQWAPVQNFLQVGQDEQLRANGYVRPVVDSDGVERELIANPVQFDNTPPDLVRGPGFAEHTDEILREIGIDDDRLIELKLAGAVT